MGECGLTFNAKKSQFNFTLLGIVLSMNGNNNTEEKVRAVVKAGEPTTAEEVRSVQGLVNYSARFIRDLATISEPLRRLTKKRVSFNLGLTFQELKDKL